MDRIDIYIEVPAVKYRDLVNHKASRTIADLEGHENIQPAHLSEAIQYRSVDRNLIV